MQLRDAMAAAAASGSTGSYCRGQMPRVDDEQKGAKRKKKRQEIEEQKKTFSPVFLSGKRRRPPIGCRPTFFRGNDQPISEPKQRRVGATLAALRRKSFGAASSFLAAAEVS